MEIINGDSLEVLKSMESESFEALITDPPYGLSKMTTENIEECLTKWLSGDKYEHQGGGFMNKAWDSFVPSPELWKEVYRVMKHGAHGLVFAGSRTQDLMSISLRLAGFEVRDTLMWVYGSGFPKSHNISKALDKHFGFEISDDGYRPNYKNKTHGKGWGGGRKTSSSKSKSEKGKQWNGWGTALKPAYEPIILVRKPPIGSIAQNTLDYGCGGINIDASRIPSDDKTKNHSRTSKASKSKGIYGDSKEQETHQTRGQEIGRFPANVMIDEHIEQEEMKRYFYCAKTSKKEREAGLSHIDSKRANTHPTVKPLDLMRYLVKLIVPEQGVALDPFCGSGSTLCALALEQKNGVGIELQEEYCKIARVRVKHHTPQNTPTTKNDLVDLPLFAGLKP
jgi:site-specific DNA-methyltransferase (adenine-specific)